MENVLVLGNGGREHALAAKLAASPEVEKVYVAPGNAGIGLEEHCFNVPRLRTDDFSGIAQFVRENKIGLTVVGPEEPLADGIVDYFQKTTKLEREGHMIFGPTKDACIEASKEEQKELMHVAGIPTAAFVTSDNPDYLKRYIKKNWDKSGPFVVKADGLCAGKGVVVPNTLDEAITAIDHLRKRFPMEARYIVVEERLFGEELSVMAFCDGKTFKMLPISQDHKSVFDGDKGPNTGGMGAFSPVPNVGRDIIENIAELVFAPALETMRGAGFAYKGIMYAGLMMTKDGPKVLEFNSRFGDPETQAVLPLLKTDLYGLMIACIKGWLHDAVVESLDGAACTVVMTAKGYPDKYPKREPIRGLSKVANMENVYVFHSGTAKGKMGPLTNGGRVLSVTGIGADLRAARGAAYAAVDKIGWKNEHHRTDIALPAVAYMSRLN